MQTVLPNTPELEEDLKVHTLWHRWVGVGDARKLPEYWSSEYEYQGYIHLLSSNRFFIYQSKFNFYRSDEYHGPRFKVHLLKEEAIEVTMDEWLDEMLINP
jgi:hypothetical protein